MTELRDLKSRADLANALGVKLPHLSFVLYRLPESAKYRAFEIPKKSGGTRPIDAPRGPIARLQDAMHPILSRAYRTRGPVHGFVPERSIVSNAEEHSGSRWIFNIDLAEFFHSITFPRVLGLLMSRPYEVPKDVAVYIAQLCCYRGRLPQGASTSPALSNMLCARMDREMMKLAASHRCRYTRYADDLTFSTLKRAFPPAICAHDGESPPGNLQIGSALAHVIDSNGFAVNPDKTRLSPFYAHQEVTGLTANQRPNVPRKYVRQLRALIHACERDGVDLASRTHSIVRRRKMDIREVIRGRIEFLRSVRGARDVVYRRYGDRFRMIDPTYRPTETSMSPVTKKDVFICHASENKERYARPLAKALSLLGISYWIDEAEIKWGDGVTAKINEGLRDSNFVIVLLSREFLAKRWAQKELYASLAQEIDSGKTRILPVLIAADSTEEAAIIEAFPLIADKLYKRWADPPTDIASEVALLKPVPMTAP